MRRGDVPDVSHAGIDLAALERERRAWHAPAHHRHHALAIDRVDDWGRVVREDGRERREVARPVAIDPEGVPNGVLPFIDE